MKFLKSISAVAAFLFLAATVFVSCDKSEFEFSSTPCYVFIDNSVHQNPVLASGLTRYSGTFVTISTATKSGARYFIFKDNHGSQSESRFNAYDERRSLQIGKNGAVVVGYGNSVDGILYAYDLECPNCFNPDALPLKSRQLAISESGMASCPYCHRKYDMNNGGFITDGDNGNKLTRYRCSATGPNGVLTVN